MPIGGSMSSPTQRTLAYCRARGLLACIVEKWIAQVRRRVDAFGFGDLLALDGQPGAVLLQVTSSAHVADRVTKIREECTEAARAWLAAGNRIVVIGWSKRGKRGARKTWQPRFVEVVLEGNSMQATERAGLSAQGA
jgi:hypothetical protein